MIEHVTRRGFSWQVSTWMSKHVYVVRPDDRMSDVLKIMCDHRVRHVPVVDGGKLVGIVSDRDVRDAMPDALGVKAHDAMTRLPMTIGLDATVREAAEVMCREKIGALPVMDGTKMAGIISSEDLLWVLVEMPQPSAE